MIQYLNFNLTLSCKLCIRHFNHHYNDIIIKIINLALIRRACKSPTKYIVHSFIKFVNANRPSFLMRKYSRFSAIFTTLYLIFVHPKTPSVFSPKPDSRFCSPLPTPGIFTNPASFSPCIGRSK